MRASLLCAATILLIAGCKARTDPGSGKSWELQPILPAKSRFVIIGRAGCVVASPYELSVTQTGDTATCLTNAKRVGESPYKASLSREQFLEVWHACIDADPGRLDSSSGEPWSTGDFTGTLTIEVETGRHKYSRKIDIHGEVLKDAKLSALIDAIMKTVPDRYRWGSRSDSEREFMQEILKRQQADANQPRHLNSVASDPNKMSSPAGTGRPDRVQTSETASDLPVKSCLTLNGSIGGYARWAYRASVQQEGDIITSSVKCESDNKMQQRIVTRDEYAKFWHQHSPAKLGPLALTFGKMGGDSDFRGTLTITVETVKASFTHEIDICGDVIKDARFRTMMQSFNALLPDSSPRADWRECCSLEEADRQLDSRPQPTH